MRHEEIMLTICLEIPASGRKIMQDPEFTPGDARFLARLGFETVMDPEGLNAINEETLVFQVGGYNYLDWRVMDGLWPAAYIKWLSHSCTEKKLQEQEADLGSKSEGGSMAEDEVLS